MALTGKSIGKKEFLALDTLLKSNPQGCLVVVSKSMDSERGFKILAITPNLPFLVKDMPSESWLEELKSGRKDPGYIRLSQNLANLIRLAMLYKYGGIYLDTDFVILKDFLGLRNAVGAQIIDKNSKQRTTLNNAVMTFDVNHSILENFIDECAKTFNGNKWGHNGPYSVSRVIERVGNSPGYNLTILPPCSWLEFPSRMSPSQRAHSSPRGWRQLMFFCRASASLAGLSGKAYWAKLKENERVNFERCLREALGAFYAVDWVGIHRLFRKPKKRSESRAVNITLNELNDEET
ncbi:hypothetical protein ACFX19_033445 [Malus domestica]